MQYKCETCELSLPAGTCPSPYDKAYYLGLGCNESYKQRQPKPAPAKLLGETVLPGLQHSVIAQAQDATTRSEIAKVLKVEMVGWRDHKIIISELMDFIDRLIAELEEGK